MRQNLSFCTGSPPHTWRILTVKAIIVIPTRITSTHVENTLFGLIKSVVIRDHLHTRGEYCLIVYFACNQTGSPPHTWRIPSSSLKFSPIFRITSTHVENTLSALIVKPLLEDHLHTRGEYRHFLSTKGICKGITSTHVENTLGLH